MLSTQEVANLAGVHKLTLIRWLKAGQVQEPTRDWRGWRVFNEREAMEVVAFAAGDAPSNDNEPPVERLKALDWSFTGAKTSYLTHGLHPYPAKFIPQIPNAVIQELSSVGDKVADIFCGSGTTLLEALQLKRNAIGIDANPLAALISRAKTLILDDEDLAELAAHRDDCRRLGDSLRQIDGGLFSDLPAFTSSGWRPDAEMCEFWFEPFVVEELAEVLRLQLRLSERARSIAQVALSANIVAVSKQDSDTRYTRSEKSISPGDTIQRYVSSLGQAIVATGEVADVLEERFSCTIHASDILNAPDVGNIDLMVTSPPYPNAFSYHLYHRTRMLWLGMDAEAFKRQEIGSHRKYSAKGRNQIDETTFATEFAKIMRWLADRMKTGAYACFIIGNSTIRGRLIDNAELISSVGAKCGFAESARIERTIQATKKAFNPAYGKIKTENLLIMRRT
jgi:site-specific DNA-methyltransferase (cytosine-N4-specific)